MVEYRRYGEGDLHLCHFVTPCQLQVIECVTVQLTLDGPVAEGVGLFYATSSPSSFEVKMAPQLYIRS
jgi:hypothetical protein